MIDSTCVKTHKAELGSMGGSHTIGPQKGGKYYIWRWIPRVIRLESVFQKVPETSLVKLIERIKPMIQMLYFIMLQYPALIL